MRVWIASVGVDRTYQGREFLADVFVELEESLQRELAFDDVFKSAIDDGFVLVSFNGVDSISSADKAKAFLESSKTFASSWAADKNNVDQVIEEDSAVVANAERIIWDLIGDYDLLTSKFFPPIDGIWNANGTIAVKDCVNVARISIQVWRDDELWFTVAQVVPHSGLNFLPFSCDVDGYKSAEHDFDLRILLEKTNPLDPVSATVSGSDEETAWGMTFLQQLVTPSPT
jgi:hypothetical protein